VLRPQSSVLAVTWFGVKSARREKAQSTDMCEKEKANNAFQQTEGDEENRSRAWYCSSHIQNNITSTTETIIEF